MDAVLTVSAAPPKGFIAMRVDGWMNFFGTTFGNKSEQLPIPYRGMRVFPDIRRKSIDHQVAAHRPASSVFLAGEKVPTTKWQ